MEFTNFLKCLVEKLFARTLYLHIIQAIQRSKILGGVWQVKRRKGKGDRVERTTKTKMLFLFPRK